MKSVRQALTQSLEAAGSSGLPLPSASPSLSVISQVLDHGSVNEESFLSNLAPRLGMPWVDMPVPDSADAPELKRLLPPRVALRHQTSGDCLLRAPVPACGSDAGRARTAHGQPRPWTTRPGKV